MANVGYVQLRRGILEHLQDGRMTSDEFAAFTVVLLKADHKTGVWRGAGKALARLLGWCERKGRLVLASLAAKGYLSIALGSRLIQAAGLVSVVRYFSPGRRGTGIGRGLPDRGTGMPHWAEVRHPGADRNKK